MYTGMTNGHFTPTVIDFLNLFISSSEYWKNGRKTVLLVHGFNSYPTKWYNQELIGAFLDYEVCNLLFSC